MLGDKLLSKYSRLVLTQGIGVKGLERLRALRVAVVGCGATGSYMVELLARLGVGYIRVIDGDFLDYSNLYRMALVTEEDARRSMPKAVACAERARQANSDAEVEAVVDRLEPENAEELLDGVDVVLDGTDNFRTRLLINEVAVSKGVPWVYVGVEGWYANVMLVEPGRGPCLHCLVERPPRREEVNVCDVIGVFPSVVSMASSVAVGVAVRHLLGLGDYAGVLYVIDAARMTLEQVRVQRRPDCPVCARGLRPALSSRGEGARGWLARPICGTEAVEIKPPKPLTIDLEEVARAHGGRVVAANPYLVRVAVGDVTVTLFRTGRAIVDGTTDVARALRAYSEVVRPLGISVEAPH